ncbi:hypothetical protein [Sphingobium baderi]|uniref:hypothetical protein n=1 Tax=Sphingobium baderi TaxID=1332080 RepID=UPI0012E3F31C|nr:hypothetical protein [Sphingobium baderi]
MERLLLVGKRLEPQKSSDARNDRPIWPARRSITEIAAFPFGPRSLSAGASNKGVSQEVLQDPMPTIDRVAGCEGSRQKSQNCFPDHDGKPVEASDAQVSGRVFCSTNGERPRLATSLFSVHRAAKFRLKNQWSGLWS